VSYICRIANRRRILAGLIVLVMVTGLLHSVPASADRRSYVWTYDYQTKTPGEVELEHYLTSLTPDARRPGETSWEHRIELEIGLTDRWDFSIYQIFSQPVGGGFRYDAFQLRSRVRLGESGMWPVDPLLYFEYRRPSDLTAPNKLEGKLVMARDFGRVNLALNLIEEVKFAPGSEWKTGYSAGVSFEPRPVVKIGAELFGDLATEGAEAHYLGPTVSLAKDQWFYAIGVGFGLNHSSNDLRARAILGVGL
jgi:hypothetical protein